MVIALKHIVLGTAGHVDHGKTSLVRRITGYNTDRLKEEILRGITIELGFAPFVLPNGQRLGIVDVPGHERFVKNMLAGATGVDLFMLVIAADEGVMPQTREHIDILRLLGVNRGVIVISKTDLVDSEWLELVLDDIKEYLGGGAFCDAPIVPVSVVSGDGIPELLDTISELCMHVTERSSSGIARLAADRVFTMAGFGTVVTGTLWGGVIRQGDSLELLPSRKQARVRSLQVHGEKCDEAHAGQRVAVNLTGVEKHLVERGNWLASPGALRENRRVDIRLELLGSAPDMAQRSRVHVHHGTTEVLARVKLLDRDSLPSGESCFAQLELEAPLSALPGDRVILRFYSPMFTIGGGTILDAAASRHRRRRLGEGLNCLEALHSGDPKQILLASMAREGLPFKLSDISSCLQIGAAEADSIAIELAGAGQLQVLPDGYFFATELMSVLCERLEEWLGDFFSRLPLRYGASKKEVAQAVFPRFDQKIGRAFFTFIEDVDAFGQDDKSVWLSGWRPVISDDAAGVIGAVREMYAGAPLAPPSWSEVVSAVDIPSREQGEYLQWFLHGGELVRVSEDAFFLGSALVEAERVLRGGFPDGFSLAEARDLLSTNRKSVHLIGEHFDNLKLTFREGDKRFWRVPLG